MQKPKSESLVYHAKKQAFSQLHSILRWDTSRMFREPKKHSATKQTNSFGLSQSRCSTRQTRSCLQCVAMCCKKEISGNVLLSLKISTFQGFSSTFLHEINLFKQLVGNKYA